MDGTGLLELPAGLAVRWVALRLLDEAAAAHARLADPTDEEALHAFRVALRRLRSTLRGYRGVLAGSVKGRDRRRLSELAGATGAARDAEVRVAWIENGVKRARGAERDALRESLAPARIVAAEARSELIEAAAVFPGERRRLRRALREFEARVSADEPPGGVPFRRVLATQLREAVAGVASHLATVLGEEQQREAHDARTAAKRLRYLLEPVRDDLPGARDVLKELKGLQDVLGEMHDADVMLALAAAEGEVAAPVRERLEAERSKRFAALRAGWLEGAAEPFTARVLALADTLEGGGAGVEIERKYLLRRMPRLDPGAEVREIEQGYLPGDRLAERVRRVRTPEGTRWYRTVKLGAGVRRIEVEEATTERIFRVLWTLTRGRRVRKRRYVVPHGDLVWEIDRFRGRRLVLAEVELPAEDTEVEIPEWLRPVLVREVTDDPAYLNLNLAR